MLEVDSACHTERSHQCIYTTVYQAFVSIALLLLLNNIVKLYGG